MTYELGFNIPVLLHCEVEETLGGWIAEFPPLGLKASGTDEHHAMDNLEHVIIKKVKELLGETPR